MVAVDIIQRMNRAAFAALGINIVTGHSRQITNSIQVDSWQTSSKVAVDSIKRIHRVFVDRGQTEYL